MSDMSKRIKQAMDIRGMKQVELCDKTGIGKSSISTYLAGEYEPKQRNLFKIAEALQVNVAWLMGQNVPMTGDIVKHTSNNVYAPNGDLSALREQLHRKPKQRILFDRSKELTDSQIDVVLGVVNEILKDRNNDDI